jgi:hypothetical protein
LSFEHDDVSAQTVIVVGRFCATPDRHEHPRKRYRREHAELQMPISSTTAKPAKPDPTQDMVPVIACVTLASKIVQERLHIAELDLDDALRRVALLPEYAR